MNELTHAPFDRYFGGKNGSGTYQTIINQIPPHRVYVEPCVGSGAIWRKKRAASISLLNDIDPAVVDKWVKAMMPECNQMDRVQEGSQIFNLDATCWLRKEKQWLDRKDTFIYVDPPYPLDSRRSINPVYRYGMADQQHRELLVLLDRYQHARIAISTYPNAYYDQQLAGWRRMEYQSTTRHGPATEVLLMNYTQPTELHDYRYVGNDYRERERIAKKVRRHLAKFNALPPLERQALLSALLQHRQE